METYRDQYVKLFKDGKGVTVIGISVDDDTVLANWARDKKFPILFASDPDRKVGEKYDVNYPFPLKLERRVLFVIGPDGRVSHVMRPFREMVQDSYDELAEAVKQASGAGRP
jgi:peroxiredoxin